MVISKYILIKVKSYEIKDGNSNSKLNKIKEDHALNDGAGLSSNSNINFQYNADAEHHKNLNNSYTVPNNASMSLNEDEGNIVYLDTNFNDVHRPVLEDDSLNNSVDHFNEKNYYLNVN